MSRWSFAASAILHIALCALALLLPVPVQMPLPREDSIEVEIVNLPPPVLQEKHEPVRQKPLAAQEDAVSLGKSEEKATPTVPQEAEPKDETPAMVKPSRMLSEEVLDDPRSRKARKELAALAPADQVEQLCGLEPMAQVGEWSKELRPDRVVAYAMADPKIVGNAFSADGAALHSKQDWYALKFKCELTLDHKKVAAFEFLMGDPIPKNDWGEHSLPDESESLD
ncbi:DUF930 domain-containing protein [Rhizobium sp. NPDC090275]|uniref:DUF930 domain-containing protein n=1 Tax=Rhizobium sp. NPDC090275 TaxID=3364498 RepID=UPI00383A0F8A